MAQRTEAIYNGRSIGIESIYTVIDGKQINIPEKLGWLREKSRNSARNTSERKESERNSSSGRKRLLKPKNAELRKSLLAIWLKDLNSRKHQSRILMVTDGSNVSSAERLPWTGNFHPMAEKIMLTWGHVSSAPETILMP